MAKIKRRRRRKCSKCGRVGHYAPTCKRKKKTTRKKSTRKKTTRKTTRKKKKAIRKRSKAKPKTKEYWVMAYYSTKKHGWGALDGKITRAAKRPANGAGTALNTGIRDLSFDFKRKDAAERAAKRIRKVKGVKKVKVMPIMLD